MAYTTIQVQGLVTLPTDEPAAGYRLKFELKKADKDSALVVPHQLYYTIPADGNIDVPLWPNARGIAGTVYYVYLIPPRTPDPNQPIGTLTVPDVAGPVNIWDHFDVAPPPTLSDAEAAELAAQGYAGQAQAWAEAAQAAAENVNVDVDDALTAANAARDKAAQWAEEVEDTEVEVGAYSAKHHRAKAEDAQAASVAAQAAAEAARDAAVAGAANLYADTTAGLAGTSSGEYFTIPSPGSDGFLDLYLNSSGTAVLKKTYPSIAKVFEAYDMETLRVLTGIGTNYADVSLISEGYIRNSDGAYVANASYESTDFVAVDPEQLIEIEVSASLDFTSGTSNITFYDASKTKIGAYGVTDLREFVRPSDHVSGCRFIRATDYNHLQPSDGFVLRVHATVDPSTIDGMVIDWFADDSVEVYNTFYNVSTGVFTANENWDMTGLIPVFQGQKIVLTADTSGTTTYPTLMGFDEKGVFVTALSTVDADRAEFTISNPAIKYVRGASQNNTPGVTPSLLTVRLRNIPHPKAVMPDEILGMAGEGLPVFARSIIPDTNFPVSWNAEDSSERAFIAERASSGVDTYRLGTVVDNGRARLDLGLVNFRFYGVPAEPATDLNIICLGDSTTEGTGSLSGGTYRDWPNELSRQITGVGTEALVGNTYFTPWNLTKVHFRGTRGLNTVKHEGYGGWSGYDFLNRATDGGKDNAFWNPAAAGGAGDFDFDFYLTDNGFDVGSDATGVDATGSNLVVFIQLGWNLEGTDTMSDTIDDIGTIIDKIHAARADTKICLLGLPPTPDLVRRQTLPAGGRFITDEIVLNEWIIPHRELGRALAASKSNTIYYDLGPTFDAETGYTADVDYWQITPWDTTNKYSAARDYVHPDPNGNVMVARALKALIAQEYL